jgi:putative membrane protein
MSLKVLTAAVSAALALAACGDDERTTARSGADSTQRSADSPAGATTGQNANNPSTSSGVTSGTNPTPTGQSGATMSGNTASNASPGSPQGGTASTTPPSTSSPSATAPMSDQTRAGSPPTTGSSPAAGAAGPSSDVSTATSGATSGAASGATTAAGKAAGDASKNAVGTTEKRFMTSAASGGMLEVEAGRVVAQQGSNAAVRQLAERLVRDHETANTELKQLAAAKNVQIPGEMSSQDRAMVDKLRKMQGNELDRAYVEQVGRAHHRKDIEEFERAARESNDPDVRAFAQKQLPVLRQHYEMAQQAAKQVATSK